MADKGPTCSFDLSDRNDEGLRYSSTPHVYTPPPFTLRAGDSDADGAISYDEFVMLVRQVGGSSPSDDLFFDLDLRPR